MPLTEYRTVFKDMDSQTAIKHWLRTPSLTLCWFSARGVLPIWNRVAMLGRFDPPWDRFDLFDLPYWPNSTFLTSLIDPTRPFWPLLLTQLDLFHLPYWPNSTFFTSLIDPTRPFWPLLLTQLDLFDLPHWPNSTFLTSLIDPTRPFWPLLLTQLDLFDLPYWPNSTFSPPLLTQLDLFDLSYWPNSTFLTSLIDPTRPFWPPLLTQLDLFDLPYWPNSTFLTQDSDFHPNFRRIFVFSIPYFQNNSIISTPLFNLLRSFLVPFVHWNGTQPPFGRVPFVPSPRDPIYMCTKVA